MVNLFIYLTIHFSVSSECKKKIPFFGVGAAWNSVRGIWICLSQLHCARFELTSVIHSFILHTWSLHILTNIALFCSIMSHFWWLFPFGFNVYRLVFFPYWRVIAKHNRHDRKKELQKRLPVLFVALEFLSIHR